MLLKPIHLQAFPQRHSRAMQHDPKVVWRDLQGVTNLGCLHPFHFPQHKNIGDPPGKLSQTISKYLPELGAMHYGFGLPFERAQIVIPKPLGAEFMSEFILQKLEISKAGFRAKFSKVVADFVLQDSAKPASFGRFSFERTKSPDCGEERLLY